MLTHCSLIDAFGQESRFHIDRIMVAKLKSMPLLLAWLAVALAPKN